MSFVLGKKFLLLVLINLFFIAGSAVSGILPVNYETEINPSSDGRLASNSIIDIRVDPVSIWLGSGRGIVQHYLDGSGWATIRSGDLIGAGGVSALVVTDSIIWAATAKSEKINDQYYPVGGGVGYSRDAGLTWEWMPQPIDSADVVDYSPTTTAVQNVTYDIAMSETAVWITSWGGGLRKFRYGGDRWEIVTPDGQSFDVWNNLRHRAFSAVYAGGSLWIGTAKGVSRTVDEGMHWESFAFKLDEPTISGDFVTALGAQELGDRTNIWAATWKAESAYEYYGVSVTEDNGRHWRVALSDSTRLPSGEYLVDAYGPLRAHNFAFRDSTVYVAADDGLWISHDNGRTWGDGPLQVIYDPTINEELNHVDFYSVLTVGDSLWVGTNAGLAVGWLPEGEEMFSWRIHRAHQPAGTAGQPETYAYPNPFSPERGQLTRFQINVTEPMEVTLGIWNFAMEPVLKPRTFQLSGGGENDMTGYGAVHWDGRDEDGDIVANGVYFYRIKASGRTLWGKIMVLD